MTNTYVDRLTEERNQLAERLDKLRAFLGDTLIFPTLHRHQKRLLIRQELVMTE